MGVEDVAANNRGDQEKLALFSIGKRGVADDRTETDTAQLTILTIPIGTTNADAGGRKPAGIRLESVWPYQDVMSRERGCSGCLESNVICFDALSVGFSEQRTIRCRRFCGVQQTFSRKVIADYKGVFGEEVTERSATVLRRSRREPVRESTSRSSLSGDVNHIQFWPRMQKTTK